MELSEQVEDVRDCATFSCSERPREVGSEVLDVVELHERRRFWCGERRAPGRKGVDRGG
jgi:hypothetical protein